MWIFLHKFNLKLIICTAADLKSAVKHFHHHAFEIWLFMCFILSNNYDNLFFIDFYCAENYNKPKNGGKAMSEIYREKNNSPMQRAKDLLSKMSLEEKLAQMRLLYIPEEVLTKEPFPLSFLEEHSDCCGALYNFCSAPATTLNKIQNYYINNTRLGIPIAIHGEGVHGCLHKDGTVFPSCVSMAASFNRELFGEVCETIGKELKKAGIDTVYAPNLDLSRDPRWGRVEEHFGEDPFLTAEFGSIYVNEIQKFNIAACPKHFAAHGSPEGGLNLSPVHEGKREIEEILLYPFKKVIKNTTPAAIMPAYSELDGIPLHSSKEMLIYKLRKEYGFNGFIVSDYGGIQMLNSMHKVASNAQEAGVMALEAGVDMEAPFPVGYGVELENLVKSGKVSEKLIDESVLRLLFHKFSIGLFDHPYISIENNSDNIDAEKKSEKKSNLAKRIATESVVLLKNENHILPLSKDISKLAVIGPSADCVQLGGYTSTVQSHKINSLVKELRIRFGEKVEYRKGCEYTCTTEEMLEEAAALALDSQIAIVVLGDCSAVGGGIGGESGNKKYITCGEGYDVSSLELPIAQQKLIKAIYETGTPIVLIMESGRPYNLEWMKNNIPAILQTWYPGEQGGAAICDLLFGDSNPSAKLPITFPKSAGHIPCFYNHKPSARGFYNKPGNLTNPGRDYVFSSTEPLFPFGYGLSYTEFSYNNIKATVVETPLFSVKVSIEVKNIGKLRGKESVLLFLSDCYCRITPYVKQLKGFKKVDLLPQETKEVTFELELCDFSFLNEKGQWEVEPGDFKIQIGNEDTILTLEQAYIL